MTTTVDRPAAIRKALCALVAERGFHGASMSAVARTAGVATGTAYVHYASKEDLVHATYLEIKRDLGAAVLAGLDPDAVPPERYRQLWTGMYTYLRDEPERASFLVQLEASPYYASALRLLQEQGDPLIAEAGRSDLLELLIDLPLDVLYALSLGTAVRLAAAGVDLTIAEMEAIAAATWRAVTAG